MRVPVVDLDSVAEGVVQSACHHHVSTVAGKRPEIVVGVHQVDRKIWARFAVEEGAYVGDRSEEIAGGIGCIAKDLE